MDGQIYALDLKVIDDNEVQSQSDLVESIVEFRPQGMYEGMTAILNIWGNHSDSVVYES